MYFDERDLVESQDLFKEDVRNIAGLIFLSRDNVRVEDFSLVMDRVVHKM